MATADDREHVASPDATPKRLTVVSAGTSEQSSTRMLADRLAQRAIELLRDMGHPALLGVVELAPLAVDIARAAVNGPVSDELQAAIEKLAGADAIIAATPVYKAGISGLFKSFVDVLDDDLLIAKPVLLAASAGSSRHALVVDEQMRPLFAYMRALTLPTSVFVAPEDWGDGALSERIGRSAIELAVILESPIEQRVADCAWAGYQHQFAGNASRAERTGADIDFDSPLMRLAAGGGTAPAAGSESDR
jgi:FMN reductase